MNILSLLTEYSYSVKSIFCYCYVVDDVAMWIPVDDVDDDLAPMCQMTWLSSQARVPALSGFSGRFPAKLRRAL